MKPYNSALKPFSRRLRSNMTDAEQVLWQRLRRKQLLGLQFYRQKPLRDYIVDFYCPKAALVIEIDGSQHLESQHEEKDARRDRALAALGLRVLRFDSRQVLRETDAVVEVIYRNASDNPPSPPFSKGGDGFGSMVPPRGNSMGLIQSIPVAMGRCGLEAYTQRAQLTAKNPVATESTPLRQRQTGAVTTGKGQDDWHWERTASVAINAVRRRSASYGLAGSRLA